MEHVLVISRQEEGLTLYSHTQFNFSGWDGDRTGWVVIYYTSRVLLTLAESCPMKIIVLCTYSQL